jgi:hypothetical protein
LEGTKETNWNFGHDWPQFEKVSKHEVWQAAGADED